MKPIDAGWQEQIATCLKEEVGVLGEILVADTCRETGIAAGPINIEELTRFLRQLRKELPTQIDGARVIADINRALLLEGGARA